MRNHIFFILKLVITCLSFLGAIIFKSQIDWTNFTNNCFNPILSKEILYDLSIGVFSAMILVWFIDEIGNHIQKRKSQEMERNVIKRLNKILLLYIEQYIDLFYCVATPLESRDPQNVKFPNEFKLKDMRDLHSLSTRLNEKIYGSSIEAFLRIEHELRDQFIHILQSHNFEYYPRIPEILTGYVRFSLAFDCRAAILDAPNRTLSSQNGQKSEEILMTKYIHDWLEKEADAYFQENLDKDVHVANPLTFPYICLYQLMRHEKKYILQYLDEMKRIDELHSPEHTATKQKKGYTFPFRVRSFLMVFVSRVSRRLIMNKEYENYKVFLDEIDDTTLKTRAELSLKYYIEKATLYKNLWNVFSIAAIVLPAVATLFVALCKNSANDKIAIITALTTVVTGCSALFKFADKKTSYRNSAENLKSELCAYASQKGIYSKKPEDNNDILFERMESIIKEGYQKIEALEGSKAKTDD